MTFEPWQLFGCAVGYLALLFLIAWLAERGHVPNRVARHPATITLSLGVYATSWSYYGSVGFADSAGFSFLTIYLGLTVAFLLGPVLLMPLLRLVREYQLTSVADLFAFRYPGPVTGLLVTLFMLLGILPYISLQIQAVAESAEVLTDRNAPDALAFVFCATLTLFAILFGARHLTPRETHSGLVVAIAFESAVKLIALLAVGAFAIWGVLGGLGGMQAYTQNHPEAVERLYAPVTDGPWTTLLLLAFCAAFLLPRQFHMAFTENPNPAGLRAASWMFPLYLLLLNLPIIPILWAGREMGTATDPDFYVLGITLGQGHGLLPLATFIGGISAASAMMIVTTLALASMALNHCILPLRFMSRRPQTNLYRWVLWGKRALIALVVAAGYGFYRVIVHNQGLVQLGLISFVAVAQLLPGIIGVLYWRRATTSGFLAGLTGGALIWFSMLITPLLINSGILAGTAHLAAFLATPDVNPWSGATFWSLAVNSFLFIGVSLLSRPGEAESKAAQACTEQRLIPLAGRVEAGSPQDFERQLARLVGQETAETEVHKALSELDMPSNELRPTELRLLRERIHRNLSGLVGPMLAQLIVDDRLQLKKRSHIALADGIRFMEDQLADSRNRLRGLTAQLHALQRYHRDVLHELPLGVCALAPDGEIVIWNHAMETVSGIPARDAIGKNLAALPPPWGEGLGAFTSGEEHHRFKQVFHGEDRERWCNLHKARIDHAAGEEQQADGMVVLVEDRTDLETLEAELRHSERLASIGRLAAGVAHEIGNPLTGVTSLAQNLQYDETVERRRETADAILEQTRRISAIVESLLAFSHGGRPRPLDCQQVEVRPAIDEAIRLVGLGRTEKHIDFRNECSAGLVVSADPQLLQQVFVNLLSNAADASEPGDRVTVHGESSGSSEVVLQVIDQGRGIDPEVAERVFDPFFTTKPVGQGTGLGLPLIHSIVSEHGGHISLAPGEKGGTIVTLRLPAAESLPAHAMESGT